jgi:chromosome segregation ATPase
VAAISAADTRFVSLLTRLDSIEADIGETVVASASIQERIAALSTEEAGLAEKALAPGMDGMLVMRLGAQLDDLNTRVESLRAEAAQLEARVAAARQGIGYLQGGLLALQPEASAAPKGR